MQFHQIIVLFTIVAFFPFVLLENGQAEEVEDPSIEIIDVLLEESRTMKVDQFKWLNRLLIVFSDSPNDPRFGEQMQNLQQSQHQLIERDLLVLVDTNPVINSTLRKKYRPRGFVILLISKDGVVVLRKPVAWDVRELSNAIDKLPIRQQEMHTGDSQ